MADVKLTEDMNIVSNSNIEIELLGDNLNIIQDLDDEPNDVGGLTSAELKAKFDEGTNKIKTYINEKLIPAIIASDAVEEVRKEAENQRSANEETRIENENSRYSAEQSRVSAEQNRAAAEQARASAEAQRAAAETDRQSKSAAMQVWEDYDSAKAYVPLNKVAWNGSSYICVQPCTGVMPDNGDYWLMIAKKGTDGATVSASGQYGFAVEDGHLILYYTGDTPPDFTISDDGHLILNFDGTHTMDIGAVIGPRGDAGQGVPAGGTAGQVLTKSGSGDYETEWKDAPSGSGSGTGSSYILPIASPATLGGVQPVAKTDAMTQSVGVDASGALWAPPGSGGGSGGANLELVYSHTCDGTYVYVVDDVTLEDGKIYMAEFTVPSGSSASAFYCRIGSSGNNTWSGIIIGYVSKQLSSQTKFTRSTFIKLPSEIRALSLLQFDTFNVTSTISNRLGNKVYIYCATADENLPSGTKIEIYKLN